MLEIWLERPSEAKPRAEIYFEHDCSTKARSVLSLLPAQDCISFMLLELFAVILQLMSVAPVYDLDAYIKDLCEILDNAESDQDFLQKIVDAPFEDRLRSTLLGLGFLAFLRVNKKDHMLDRITISDTATSRGAINMTNKPFHDMKVPLNHKGNIVLTAIATGHYQQTSDWHLLTDPAVTAEESRMNQAAAGIATSIVYPLMNIKPKGAIIFQYYLNMGEITPQQHNFMFRYIKAVTASYNKRFN